MTIISDLILCESKTARNNLLADMFEEEAVAVAQKQLILCCHKLAQIDPKLPELVFSHSELNPPKEKEEDSFPDNSFEATPYGRKGNNHNGFYVNNSLTPSF